MPDFIWKNKINENYKIHPVQNNKRIHFCAIVTNEFCNSYCILDYDFYAFCQQLII